MCSKTQKARRAPDTTWRVSIPRSLDRDQLAGLDLAQELGADDVEARRTRRRRSSGRRACRGRAGAGRAGRGTRRRSCGHHHGREGALEPRHDVGDRVLDALGLVGGEQRRDDLRVGGRAEARRPGSRSSVCSSTALMRLPLWASASSRPVRAVHRLGVLPGAGPGGRVAHVPDRHLAGERAQLLLVEDLDDEAEVAQGHDVPVLAGGDPRGLLAAVLQRVEGEVREPATSCSGA